MRVVIEIRGGLVQEIYADAEVNVLILDYDCLDDVTDKPAAEDFVPLVNLPKVSRMFKERSP